MKRYEQVLNIDRYNIAARNGMELVNKQRSTYYNEAYDETRSRMLWLVDRAWERPVRKISPTTRSSETAQFLNQSPAPARDAIIQKLNNIQIDRIDLNNVSIREAVDTLRQMSRNLDRSTDDQARRGVNIVLRIPISSFQAPDLPGVGESPEESGPIVTENTKITLSLRDVPMM
jgi:general secretion pathway protein D